MLIPVFYNSSCPSICPPVGSLLPIQRYSSVLSANNEITGFASPPVYESLIFLWVIRIIILHTLPSPLVSLFALLWVRYLYGGEEKTDQTCPDPSTFLHSPVVTLIEQQIALICLPSDPSALFEAISPIH